MFEVLIGVSDENVGLLPVDEISNNGREKNNPFAGTTKVCIETLWKSALCDATKNSDRIENCGILQHHSEVTCSSVI